jgi:hypothetical protein
MSLELDLLEKLFPDGAITVQPVTGLCEVACPDLRTEPANCDVLLAGEELHAPVGERRTHYLVRAGGHLVLLNVASAPRSFAGAEIATMHGLAREGTASAQHLARFAESYIGSECRPAGILVH